MGRSLVGGRTCVRCGSRKATPYLRRHWGKLLPEGLSGGPALCLDLGCGNGRNGGFLEGTGRFRVVGLDLCGPGGGVFVLGRDRFPAGRSSVHAFLCNYVFMFLCPSERAQVIGEVHRTAAPDARMMVEMYPARRSQCPGAVDILCLQTELSALLGWEETLSSPGRFIARNRRLIGATEETL